MELPDNAVAVKNTGNKFAAFLSRYRDVARVLIFRRLPGYRIDFGKALADYETSPRGATASARKEIHRLTTRPDQVS